MSASARGPLQTMLPSSMNASVSATFERVLRVLLDEQDGAAAVAQLEDGVHDRFGGEGREAERGLVGDEHDRRVGERRREAQHLLLAAGEQAGDLLAPLLEDREPLVGACARSSSVAQQHGEVLLDGEAREDAAGLGDEEHAVARPAVRLGVGDVVALEEHRADGSVDEPGRDRAQRGLAGAVGAEQRGDACPRRVGGRRRGAPRRRRSRDDALHREGRVGDRLELAGDAARPLGVGGSMRRARARARGRRRRAASASAAAICGSDAASARCFVELLLAGEGEDAVGLLGELDRTEARQDRHEVDRRDRAR